MGGEAIREEWLYLLWSERLLPVPLYTTDGEPVLILEPGKPNWHQEGPDFLEARIRVGNLLWVGDVEFHVRASDWFRHHHTNHTLYQSVILHIVYQMDVPVGHFRMPVIELAKQVNPAVWAHLHQWHGTYARTQGGFPCKPDLSMSRRLPITNWLIHCGIARLTHRASLLRTRLQTCEGQWLDLLKDRVLYAAGAPTNSMGMQQVGEALKWQILARYLNQSSQFAALLLGVAGFLHPEVMAHWQLPQSLLAEWTYLRQKHQLQPIAWQWRTGRIRPGHHPVRRLIQVIPVLQALPALWKLLLAFSWQEVHHYLAELLNTTVVASSVPPPGEMFHRHLLINALIPVLYTYGEVMSQPQLKEKAIQGLELLPAEDNRYVRQWKRIAGWQPATALETQGILHLLEHYCAHLRCACCQIGIPLLRRRLTQVATLSTLPTSSSALPSSSS